MTQLAALPPVAQRYYTECKKCACERFHIVVAHTSANAAKLECEVCHTKRSLKLGGKAKTKSTKTSRAEAKAKASVTGRWEEVKNLLKEGEKQPYNMRSSFTLHSTIDHPKFGLGVVTATGFQSMEVVFEDGTRSLVHNRH